MIPETSLVFRPATAADVPAIVALVESAYRGEESRRGWTTEADLLDGQRTDECAVAGLLSETGARIVLAERGSQLLACAHLQRVAGQAYFGMFAVRPEGQGAGIGSALLAECERISTDEWKCRDLYMTVIRQREDLLRWYRRRGYHLTGETRPFPYGDARFGLPRRPDLVFVVLAKPLGP